MLLIIHLLIGSIISDCDGISVLARGISPYIIVCVGIGQGLLFLWKGEDARGGCRKDLLKHPDFTRYMRIKFYRFFYLLFDSLQSIFLVYIIIIKI